MQIAHLVLEAHPAAVLGEDLEVRPCLAGRVDRLVRDVDGAVDVGEATGLLGPLASRKNDVGERSSLRREDVLRNDEEVLAGEQAADAGKFGKRDSRAANSCSESALTRCEPDQHGRRTRGKKGTTHLVPEIQSWRSEAPAERALASQ